MYLTDELHLYRVIGPIDGSRTLLTVEDCHTLDVIVLETDTAADLRRVTPSQSLAA
jgi:hypothetical protein